MSFAYVGNLRLNANKLTGSLPSELASIDKLGEPIGRALPNESLGRI